MEFSAKYRLQKRLGSQRNRKFGEIFLATDNRTRLNVVIKTVKTDPKEYFNQERLKAESSFSFDFEGLPKTLDFEETKDNIFLVRQYFEGVPLDQHWKNLKRKQRLTFIIDLLQKLLPIFNHLNDLGIVHCDIKPSNILIEQQSESFRVHLLDFGLSIRTSEIKENRKRKLLFPLGYAAPELLLNQLEIVDQQTDIFALGIVIWRLYAGNLPLVHPNPSVFTNLQLTHPLPEHSEIKKKLHRVLSKMSFKHQFKIPPNRMDQQEVKELLFTAMGKRHSSLKEVIEELQLIANKRFW
jgi:serine/threonine protein kinase